MTHHLVLGYGLHEKMSIYVSMDSITATSSSCVENPQEQDRLILLNNWTGRLHCQWECKLITCCSEIIFTFVCDSV